MGVFRCSSDRKNPGGSPSTGARNGPKSIAPGTASGKTSLEFPRKACEAMCVEKDVQENRGGSKNGLITLIGTIERVTYHDEESLYSVLKVVPDSGYELDDAE